MNNVCNDVRQQFVFFKKIKQQAKVKIYLYTTVCGQSKEYEWLTKTSLNVNLKGTFEVHFVWCIV